MGKPRFKATITEGMVTSRGNRAWRGHNKWWVTIEKRPSRFRKPIISKRAFIKWQDAVDHAVVHANLAASSKIALKRRVRQNNRQLRRERTRDWWEYRKVDSLFVILAVFIGGPVIFGLLWLVNYAYTNYP